MRFKFRVRGRRQEVRRGGGDPRQRLMVIVLTPVAHKV